MKLSNETFSEHLPLGMVVQQGGLFATRAVLSTVIAREIVKNVIPFTSLAL